jgi:hypothetical protein
MKQVSQKTYLESFAKCPFCRSTNIESTAPEVDGNIAWCRTTCLSCGAVWDDEYKLVRYTVQFPPNMINIVKKPDNILAIFDNENGTFDRYSIVCEEISSSNQGIVYHDVLGLSEHPDEFSQWSECIYDGEKTSPYLGIEIQWEDLPIKLQKHIIDRISES